MMAARLIPLFLPLFRRAICGSIIDEMKPAAGLAMHRFVGAGRIARRGFVRKPVLHIHAGPGTLEDEVGHMAFSLTTMRFRVLIRVNRAAHELCKRGLQPSCRRALNALPGEGD